MDVLLTGATGFLGSHVLLHWLIQQPTSRALCLIRGNREHSASERLKRSLAQSIFDCDVRVTTDELLDRITIVEASLDQPYWRDMADVIKWLHEVVEFEVVHCAADLSFREADRQKVWQTNVGGTAMLLECLKNIPRLAAFNHISTAYVAGTKEGHLFEDSLEPPPFFNNVYEESKWTAEQIVRKETQRMSIGTRIFRPSIVVGHSTTFRISVETGLYKVLGTLVQCSHRRIRSAEPIKVPVKHNANLNLIPIDLVVREMLDLVAVGQASLNKVFHLTNERPLSVADIFYGITPLTGVCLACGTNQPREDATKEELLILRGLQDYLPYFRHASTFDRSNVCAFGANRHQREYWLDVVTLRQLAKAFIEPKQAIIALPSKKCLDLQA